MFLQLRWYCAVNIYSGVAYVTADLYKPFPFFVSSYIYSWSELCTLQWTWHISSWHVAAKRLTLFIHNHPSFRIQRKRKIMTLLKVLVCYFFDFLKIIGFFFILSLSNCKFFCSYIFLVFLSNKVLVN